MKRSVSLLVIVLFLFMFSDCAKSYLPENQIIGVWSWAFAETSTGENLMDTYPYNTATFNEDGTYNFDIGSYSHSGTYTVDSDNETLTMDGNDPWTILEISNNSLQIRSSSTNWYEWHFDK
jgi:hypothetical protein